MDLDATASIVEEADALLVDWDGCVMQGGRLIEGADRFLRRFRDKIQIVSNNSTDLPDAFAERLAREGVPIDTARVHLAGHLAVWHVVLHHPGARIFMLATPELRGHARTCGLTLAKGQEDADTVLLLRDVGLTYDKLGRAINLVRAGARLIVANPDLTHPGDDGAVIPETGALLAAIAACAPAAEPLIIGKPSAALFEQALRRAGIEPASAVMIGDNPLTDIAGAEALGLKAVLIDPARGVTLGALADRLERRDAGAPRGARSVSVPERRRCAAAPRPSGRAVPAPGSR
ncbi:HAD-IIA family hydrolase [Novosphingobium mathurense]|uniref:4-nitrophenyl phosphatase n=1 Tax=Novosphingobium mathurense TaxID=428990 RepID=A0A1U6H6A6_9SPHN|nr:HAD-IIA family hydrolase [Novosphingobium mathurense]SLJ91298.1 4-nitrophenyl phosphatase [Novosphingobium mathurense]